MSLLPRDPRSNAARIRELVGPLARSCSGRPVFLVDGDRTLSPDDTSRTFLRRAGLDPLVIKRRFEQDGYCFDAFRFHAEMHVDYSVPVAKVDTAGADNPPVGREIGRGRSR